jgi:hypothetical protein
VWSVTTLAPSFSALEADVAAQLAPVRGIERSQLRADWHRYAVSSDHRRIIDQRSMPAPHGRGCRKTKVVRDNLSLRQPKVAESFNRTPWWVSVTGGLHSALVVSVAPALLDVRPNPNAPDVVEITYRRLRAAECREGRSVKAEEPSADPPAPSPNRLQGSQGRSAFVLMLRQDRHEGHFDNER